MRKICGLCMLVLIKCNAVFAQIEAETSNHWRFGIQLEANYDQLSGTIVNTNLLGQGLGTSFFASADSMNFGHEWQPSFSGFASTPKVSFGLNYFPISYSGSGTGFATITSDSFGGFAAIPLLSTFDVDLYLAHANYNLIDTPSAKFGLGVSLGQVDIDLDLQSDSEFRYRYNASEIFGTVNVFMRNQYQRFTYGFSLSAMSASIGGSAEEYADYKLDFAYRISTSDAQIDLLGGWRFQKLGFEVQYPASAIGANLELKGPYIGVRSIW